MIIITIILPLVIASTGISIYFGVPASFFGLLIFHAWVSAAHAMESPFGDRPNDLPLAELQEEFNGRLQQLIRSTQIHSAGVAYGDQIDLSEGAILFSPTRKDAEGSEVEEEDEEGVIVAGLETLDGFGGREVEGSGANLSVLRPGISDSVTADAETSVPPVPANNQAGLSKPQMLQMQMLQEESGVPMWRRSAAGSVAIVASTVSPPTQPVATPHSVNTDAAFGSTFRLGSELVPASDAVRGFSGPSAGEDSSGTQGINPVTVSQSGPTAAGSLHASHTNSVGPLPTTELPVKLTTLGASRGPQHKDTKYKSVWGSRRPSAPAATASLKPADISLQVSPPPFPPHANTSQGLTGSASGDAGLGLQAPQDIQAARTNTDPTGLQTTGEALPPSADAQPPMLPTSPGTALNLTLPSDDMEGGKQEKENQKSPKAEKGALKPPAGQNPSTGRNSLASPVSDILSVMPSDLSPYGGSSGLALPPPAVVGDSGDVDDGEGRDGQPGRGMKQPIAKVKSMPSVLGYANSSVKSPEGSRVTPSSPDQAPLGRAASAGEGGVQTPGRGRVTPLPLSPNPSIPRDMRSHTRIGTRFSVWRQQSEDEEGGPFGRYGAAALQQRSSLRVLRGNNGRPHHTEGTQLIIPGADRAARLGMNIRSIPSFGIGLDADFAGLSASPGEKTVDLPMQKNRRPGSVAPWELHHHHNGPHHGLGVGGPSRFLTGRESTFGGIRSPRPEPDDRERDGEAGTGKDRDKDKMRQGGRQGTESPQRRKTGAESVASTRRSWWRMSIGSRSGGLAGSKSHGPLRREGTASVKGSSPVNPSDLKSEESAGGRQRSFSDDGFVTYGEGRERERERERGRKVASPVKKHGTPGPSRQKRDGKTAARVSIILPGGGEEDPHHSSSVDPELAENAGIQNLG
uniref:Uncharacterized protein n=1 Tax=Chromera velia CCMP2878 TaxID=1169474 RepID=A0A0G4HT15_9ALVE|eukprot:Cvel_31256.t1-p1 / transcript=Cvel_31256.t1 / gene=Cvel_31256 / organism=Chromera_velia_CCMP2878 / gene_product=hypothetical protein / transcript_product=hypothetical protein / location=Cvel_scaffold4624:2955-7987(-) / protein_length=912 / sequence_SO=supercontig / SO=protein_coding / is_pseudo=false